MLPSLAIAPVAQHRGRDAQLAGNLDQPPTAARQQGDRLRLELIPKVTPFLTHSTPFRSSRRLPKVSTNPGEAHLRRRPVPVQLSDAGRSNRWPHRRHPAASALCRRVPKGAAFRYRMRLLAGAQLADRDRSGRRRHRHAGRGADLCGNRRSACAVSTLDQTRHAIIRQTARLQVLRNGAGALLAQEVEAKVAEFLAQHVDLRTTGGLRRVVRHGYLPEPR